MRLSDKSMSFLSIAVIQAVEEFINRRIASLRRVRDKAEQSHLQAAHSTYIIFDVMSSRSFPCGFKEFIDIGCAGYKYGLSEQVVLLSLFSLAAPDHAVGEAAKSLFSRP